MNNNGSKLKILVQGGLVSVAILLIALLYFIFQDYSKILGNDLQHIGNFIQEGTKVQVELKGAIEASVIQGARLESAVINLERAIK